MGTTEVSARGSGELPKCETKFSYVNIYVDLDASGGFVIGGSANAKLTFDVMDKMKSDLTYTMSGGITGDVGIELSVGAGVEAGGTIYFGL